MAPWWAAPPWKTAPSRTSSRIPFNNAHQNLMTIAIWLLTFLLVLDCLVLILLVLIQLPKKEAGMGQAFGGAATDALFGAGSGTALTKMTKYTAVIFFVLTLLLWVLKAQEVKSRSTLDKTM